MLVLSRKIDEAICIGDDIKVSVVRIRGNVVRLGVSAPKDVRVMRAEIDARCRRPIVTNDSVNLMVGAEFLAGK